MKTIRWLNTDRGFLLSSLSMGLLIIVAMIYHNGGKVDAIGVIIGNAEQIARRSSANTTTRN